MKTSLILRDVETDRPDRFDLDVDASGITTATAAVLYAISQLPILGRMPGAIRAAGLALAADPTTADRCLIAVVDETGAAVLTLGSHAEEDVVALWRRIGAESGLPLMVIDEHGRPVVAQPQIGRVRLGLAHSRRGHGLLSGRRPRFLVRRKTSRLGLRPRIHRGERVIAAGGQG